MKFLALVLQLSCLLIGSTTTWAWPHRERGRQHNPRLHLPFLSHSGKHHHHNHTTATGTGAGISGGAVPTGYYPIDNLTLPGDSPSGTGVVLSGTVSETSYPAVPATSTFATLVQPSSPVLTKATSSVRASASLPFLRGVNIGSWLILESWMVPQMFTGDAAGAIDEWTYDSTNNAAANLQQHWSTWFTEADVQTLSDWGINALRIPIGYWAYDNSNTPFLQGADAYLDQAISWARAKGMKVLIDCHGSPGSQNGQDHSGHKGAIEWQQNDNLNRSTAILVTMAQKYGTMAYADTVIGLEIVNEPTANPPNSFATSQQWAKDAYTAIRAVVTNPDLLIITHDSFMGPTNFIPIAQQLGSTTFGVDVHNYQLYTDSDNSLTQPQHIAKACGWANDLQTTKAAMPVIVGEWSALTNVCVNSDGSTTAGTSCSVSGCQCVSADPSAWNPLVVEQVRRYIEAQLDVWESNTNGYFLWTWNGPGGWGLQNLVNVGAMPNPVTSRQYVGQCG